VSAAADILGALVAAKQAERETTALLEAFTARSLCTTPDGKVHEAQLRFDEDLARWIVVMCSRRAGKTRGLSNRWARRSLAKPNGNRVYLALTGGQARDIMWEPYWKPLLAERQIECDHNETRMVTTFPNGSRVKFGGTDDIRAIKKELGAGLDEACVDEGQDQQESVLADLLGRILPHALTDRRGTLICMGVVPEVEAGTFWDLYAKSAWSKHTFSQMENPFLPHAREELDEYLASNPGLNIDSPVIQRERFGKMVFDRTLTAYRYTPSLNSYVPEEPDWFKDREEWLADEYPEANLVYLERTQEPADGKARFGMMAAVPHGGIVNFHASVDQARQDRVSINVVGSGSDTPEVQQVFEWSTPRNAQLTMSQIAPIMALAQLHYDIGSWSMDGVQNELDTFAGDYGIGAVKAPNKADLPGQVRRQNDLLTKGWSKVMEGSATEQDLKKARWDKDARAKGKFSWASQWHPDPSESWRYAHAAYHLEWAPPEPPKAIETQLREKAQRRQRRVVAAKAGQFLDEDVEASIFEEGESWT
jgi:hypothetical protein